MLLWKAANRIYAQTPHHRQSSYHRDWLSSRPFLIEHPVLPIHQGAATNARTPKMLPLLHEGTAAMGILQGRLALVAQTRRILVSNTYLWYKDSAHDTILVRNHAFSRISTISELKQVHKFVYKQCHTHL